MPFVLLTEDADHSWGSSAITRSPLPSPDPHPRELPSSSLPLPLTPDWPRYISDQIPLEGAGMCGSNKGSGESAPRAIFLPLPLTVPFSPGPGLCKGQSLATGVVPKP